MGQFKAQWFNVGVDAKAQWSRECLMVYITAKCVKPLEQRQWSRVSLMVYIKMCQIIGAMTLDKSRSIGLGHVTPWNFSSWTLTICLWHVKLLIFGADHWTLRSHHITGSTYIQWMISCSYFHVKCTCTYTKNYRGILTLKLDHWNVLAKDNINKRNMVINTCWITIII